MNYMALPGIPRGVKFQPVVRNKDYVIRQVLNYFDVTLPELKKRTRKRSIVQIRYIMFYYLYTLCNLSYNDIAQMFKPAVNDHTTVLHGVQLVRTQIYMKIENEIQYHIKNITI